MLVGLERLKLEHLEETLVSLSLALKLFRLDELRLLLTDIKLELETVDFHEMGDCPIGTKGNPSSSSDTSEGIQNSLCHDSGNLYLSCKDHRLVTE